MNDVFFLLWTKRFKYWNIVVVVSTASGTLLLYLIYISWLIMQILVSYQNINMISTATEISTRYLSWTTGTEYLIIVTIISTGCLKKNVLSWKNGHNYLQNHPKCKSWGCFGKFRIFATRWALRFSTLNNKWLRKWNPKLPTHPKKLGRIHCSQYSFLWCSAAFSWLVLKERLVPCVARRLKKDNFVSLSWCV